MPSLNRTYNLGLNHSTKLSGRVLFVIVLLFPSLNVAGDKTAGSYTSAFAIFPLSILK